MHGNLESSCDSGRSVYKENFTIPEQFSQEELSDLIRDHNLSKNASEILASRLKDKNNLIAEKKVTFTALGKRSFCLISVWKMSLYTVQ